MSNPFETPGAASKTGYPSVKQLGTGAAPKDVVYAAGTEDEKVIKKATGRLCIFTPVDLEKNVPSKFKGVPPGPRMKVDVTVLDGDPITAVLDKDGDETYVFPEPLVPAFVLSGMFFSQKLVVDQLSNSDGTMRTSMVLGRLVLLPPLSAGGNKAWAIGGYSPDDLKVATKYVTENPAPSPFE
jgi:hypothetical protein